MTAITVFLAVITLCMVVFAVLGLLIFKKLSQLLTTTERTLNDLGPKVGRTFDEATGGFTDLRNLTQSVNGIVGDVSLVSGGIRKGAEFVAAARMPNALWAGIRTGVAVLRSFGRKDGKGDNYGSQD
jgi:hypothetical protein